MEEEDSSKTSIILPKFNGVKSEYQAWLVRFYAYATVKKFMTALRKNADLPTSESATINETTAAGKKKLKAKEANTVAVASLALAFTKDSLLMLVTKSMTAEWPGGLAYKIMEALQKKYQPDDQLARVEVRIALNQVKMKVKEDPSTLFEQLRMIEASYIEAKNVKFDEADMIAVVMEKAPAEYQSLITAELRREGGGTMEDLEQLLHQQWRALYGAKTMKNQVRDDDNDDDDEDDDNKEQEIGLFAGTCFNCGEQGHKKYECTKERKGGFHGKCNICGKPGHKAHDCWDDPKNANKRPHYWRPKPSQETGETGATAFDYAPEINLCSIDLNEIEFGEGLMKPKVIEEEESYSEEDGECYNEQVVKKDKKSMNTKKIKSMMKSQVTAVEAEYITASQCVKTVLMKKEELKSAGMQVALPIELTIANKSEYDLVMNGNKNKLNEKLKKNELLSELKMKGSLKPMLNGEEEGNDEMMLNGEEDEDDETIVETDDESRIDSEGECVAGIWFEL